MPTAVAPSVAYGVSALWVTPGTPDGAVVNGTFAETALNASEVLVAKTVHDDGTGILPTKDGGTVDYTSRVLVFKPAHDLRYSSWATASAGWGYTQTADSFDAGTVVTLQYSLDSAADTVASEALAAQAIRINLTPYTGDTIVAGSVQFQFSGSVYVDRLGILYRDIDPATGSGAPAGTIDYRSGIATITDWTAGVAPGFALIALLTQRGYFSATAASFRTPASPLKSEALSITAVAINGTQITASADANGNIVGALVQGTVNVEYGTAAVKFGETVGAVWVETEVDPASIRYNAVAYSYLPIDASILGVNPVRLPQDGRVPIFRKGGYAVIGHDVGVATQVVSNGQTIDLGAVRLSRITVHGADGLPISTGYTADLDAGTITFSDVSGYSQPVDIAGRYEDMLLIGDVDIAGKLTFTAQVSHAYVVGDPVSSALIFGDQHAYVSALWDQQTWDGTYRDAYTAPPATGTYDDAAHPVEVTNAGAVTERWVCKFVDTQTVQVIGEHIGLKFTGPIANDISVLDDAGNAMFTIRSGGWGGGWAAGNVMCFNTVGASPPFNVVRTVQQGSVAVLDDQFTLIARGDVNRNP